MQGLPPITRGLWVIRVKRMTGFQGPKDSRITVATRRIATQTFGDDVVDGGCAAIAMALSGTRNPGTTGGDLRCGGPHFGPEPLGLGEMSLPGAQAGPVSLQGLGLPSSVRVRAIAYQGLKPTWWHAVSIADMG
jgi:hypothetical protein